MLEQHSDKFFYGIGAALGALVLGATLFLSWRAIATGMLKKELEHFFYSPIAWLVMAGFALVNGFVYLFFVEMYSGGFAATEPFATVWFGRHFFFWILLLIVIPAITMRLLAEEKASGTIEPLMTAPVRDAEVVFAKYLAAMIFYVVLWVPTIPLIVALYYYGVPEAGWAELSASIPQGGSSVELGWAYARYLKQLLLKFNQVMDVGPFLSAYFGLLLMGSAWISIGLLASSFARNQVVAFMAAFVVLVLLFSIGFVEGLIKTGAPDWLEQVKDVARYMSFLSAYEKFPKGVIDTRPVLYFVSLSVISLFFTVRVVESRKWR